MILMSLICIAVGYAAHTVSFLYSYVLNYRKQIKLFYYL